VKGHGYPVGTENGLEEQGRKGFNTTDIPLEFCLLQGEIAEAFDAWRKGRADVGEELADVAIYLLGLDAPYDWQGAPLPAPSDVAALARDLTAAGPDAGRAAVLRDGADRAVAAWEGIAGRLPSQVVHADLAASNVLVSPDTGAVTGVLDFELAGYWIRAIELAVALALSGATHGPGWPRRAAAVAPGWRLG